MRLGIFGGTFDPIHNAHLALAREAAAAFGLDRVLFIPAANPPHRGQTVASFADRLRMIELAVDCEPGFEPSDIERHKPKSYSITTIEKLQAPGRELFFLIGADAFREIRTWHRWHEVVAAVQFIVAARPGAVYEAPEGARVLPLPLDLDTSSTRIRRQLKEGDPHADLPPAVAEYIRGRRLYRSSLSGPPAI